MKDSLIKLGGNLESPGDSKATDWPDKGASGPVGMAMGADKLIKQTVTQEGPQHTEDDGPGKPVPSDRSRVISANFSVSKNMGEADMKPGEVKPLWACGVDLETGQMAANATAQC